MDDSYWTHIYIKARDRGEARVRPVLAAERGTQKRVAEGHIFVHADCGDVKFKSIWSVPPSRVSPINPCLLTDFCEGPDGHRGDCKRDALRKFVDDAAKAPLISRPARKAKRVYDPPKRTFFPSLDI